MKSSPSLCSPAWLLAVALSSVVGGSLRGQAAGPSAPAQYGYYYHGRLLALTPSTSLLAVRDTPAAAFFAAQQGLRRAGDRDHHALRRYGLVLYAVPASRTKRAPAASAVSLIRTAAASGTVVAQPVFEQGDSIGIPADEVVVGFKSDLGKEEAGSYLAKRAGGQGILGLAPFRQRAFVARIANPSDGRAFAVSRFLAGLPGVRYSEPNFVRIMLDEARPLHVGIPEPAGGYRKAGTGFGKDGGATRALGYVPRAPVTWAGAAEGFEGTVTGWQSLFGNGATEAVPSITTFRAHTGTKSAYMTGNGAQGVAPPGPYPDNCLSVLQSPAFDLSSYEEAYVQWWFYAKYEDPSPPNFWDLGAMFLYNASTNQQVELNDMIVAYTGNLTADPTTQGGWRRALVRVPPAWRINGVSVRFLFKSDVSTGAEGLYIDDFLILGTADVDSEPISTDTYSARQYELKNSAQIAGIGNDTMDLNVPEAWAVQSVSPNIVVAVIDSGVDLTHPDLNLVAGYNADTDGPGGGPPNTAANHGTACAGNIGAIGGNGRGVVGTAPGVKIMPIFYGSSDATQAASIDWAVSHGANVLSNSWGGVGFASTAIEDAVDAALAANRTVLFAAGNGPDRPPFTYQVAFPGTLTGTTDVICVGATGPADDHKSASSSDGIFSWGSSYVGAGPDVCAPGPWSYTTDRQGTAGYNADAAATGVNADYTHDFGGTSSATPKVAGIVALLLSKNPSLTPAQVKSILRSTAKDIDVSGVDDKTGAGRVNALAAVNAVPAVSNFSISGTVTSGGTGLSGVTVTAGSKTATTSGTGAYTVTGLSAGSFTVTPSKSGYTFTPINRPVTISSASVTGVDFTASLVTYAISGTITSGGTGLSGVTVSGGGRTDTTDASGAYALIGIAPGTYTVTPSKTGYSFTPANRSVSITTGNVTGVNFTAASTATYSISGTVTSGGSGLTGVTVTAGSRTATTSSTGAYTITGLAAGSYTVTPAKSGYSFTPANRAVTITTANVTGQNFTAASTATFSISGTVTAGGTGLTGATMTAGSRTATTTSTGAYTITGLAAGSYTLTPAKSGYSFTPASRAVTITNANVTGQNFTATAVAGPRFTLADGAGAPGANVAMRLAFTANGAQVTVGNFDLLFDTTKLSFVSAVKGALPAGVDVTTNAISAGRVRVLIFGATNSTPWASGNVATLTLRAAAGATGSTTVQVVLPGTTTAGVRVSNPSGVSSSAAAAAGIVTVGTVATFSISGLVTLNAAGLAGVTVTAGGKTATTSSTGAYSITGLTAGTYTVTPTKAGHTFTPVNRSVTVGPSAVDQNFRATVSTFSISGLVTLNGAGLSGVTVTAGGKTATTSTSGAYSLTGLAAGTYTVTPAKTGHTFTPVNRSVTVGPNAVDQNFRAASSSFSISGTVTAGTAGLGGVTVQATQPATLTRSAAPALAIPDNNTTGIQSSIAVTGTGPITSVKVNVDITHTWRGDLEVSLIAPDGTTVKLFDGPRDDSTANLVTSFPDRTVPVQSLAALNGKPVAGTWKLRVRDLSAPDSGRLNSWGLTLGYSNVIGSAATTSTGAYSVTGLAAGTYTVRPVKSGYTFTPATRSVTVGPSATGVNFAGNPSVR